MKLRLASALVLGLVAGVLLRADNHNTYPLPEDRGSAGTYAALQNLPVYVRALCTTAHPDDESAGTLTWLAREAHARTALFCLTRGEGGQNILGDEKYEALGLVRTGELLEACRFYGVKPYFSTAFEFGFSKTAGETFAKWGREASLEEMVRFIRRYRPSVIISAFRGDRSDGHGHHQAAGILTREAFRAAGDAQRFPQQLKDGLFPWQAKKLYESAGRGGSGVDGVVRIPVGKYDPVLGRSPREIGAEGYSKHRSQGNGAAFALPGRAFDSFQLVDSTLSDGRNGESFFDALDTSLASILDLAGNERGKVAFLAGDLAAVQKSAAGAIDLFRQGRAGECAAEAAKGGVILSDSLRKAANVPLPRPIRDAITDALGEKLKDFENAVSSVLAINLIARADNPTAVPGDNISITTYIFNRGSETVKLSEARLQSAQSLSNTLSPGESASIAPGENKILQGAFTFQQDTPVTEPFWYRDNPNNNRYHARTTADVFAPFAPPALSVLVVCRFRDMDLTLTVPVTAQSGNPLRGSDFVELQLVPPLSVTLQPSLAIIPVSKGPQSRAFQVSVLSNNITGVSGTIRLLPPPGWMAEPVESSFALGHKGEAVSARFNLRIPATTAAGSYTVGAEVTDGKNRFRRGYRVITYSENWTRNLYFPAQAEAKVFDVSIAPNLTVGYVAGAGDDIPAALEQLGVQVVKLSDGDLASGDLSRFSAVITGIRAYNVNEVLRANSQRLLKYVEQGGTMIVQYVRPLGRSSGTGSPFPYGPYPMSNSDEARITVEESPVELLQPQHPLLNAPNKITSADFVGWVQERGLYFMTAWDPRYTALLSGHDPGEPARAGGMLVAHHGRGYYVYSAYAWFRQLPAGVPGAYRIFANMLSLGK